MKPCLTSPMKYLFADHFLRWRISLWNHSFMREAKVQHAAFVPTMICSLYGAQMRIRWLFYFHSFDRLFMSFSAARSRRHLSVIRIEHFCEYPVLILLLFFFLPVASSSWVGRRTWSCLPPLDCLLIAQFSKMLIQRITLPDKWRNAVRITWNISPNPH